MPSSLESCCASCAFWLVVAPAVYDPKPEFTKDSFLKFHTVYCLKGQRVDTSNCLEYMEGERVRVSSVTGSIRAYEFLAGCGAYYDSDVTDLVKPYLKATVLAARLRGIEWASLVDLEKLGVDDDRQ